MKLLLSLAAAVALLASPISAIALEQTKGIVESVNEGSGTLSLQSGRTFVFDNKAELAGILPGQEVGVSHDGDRGVGTYNPHPGPTHHGEGDGF